MSTADHPTDEHPTDEHSAPVHSPGAKPWWLHAIRVVGVVVVAAVVIAVLKDKLPAPSAVATAFGRARWWWVVAGLVLQLGSIGMLIRQQRRLLRAFGVPVRLRTVAAITYSSNAISLSLPAGSAIGAGYSYRQYRLSGADKATAATVLLLSGILSLIGLVLVYLLGFGVAASLRLFRFAGDHPIGTAAIGLGVLCLVPAIGALRRLRTGDRHSRRHRSVSVLRTWAGRHPRVGPFIDQLLETGKQARAVSRKDWRLTLATSAGNWALDAASLAACCLAFDIHINVFQLAMIYVGVQLIRQIPLTPGGIGVIEVALLAALVAAGAGEAAGSAAVLVYRLWSAWLLVPIGYLMLAALRHTRRSATPAPTADHPTG